MKTISCLLFTAYCLLFTVSGYAQETSDEQKLAELVGNINRFNHLYPQEKVYLHFDNTAYYLGENIWFKAYVTTAENNSPSQLSRVLYAELVTPDGDIMETRKYKIEDGMAHGNFFLKDSLYTGYYEVRAYTRSMLNFGEEVIFSRVFPVFDNPAVSGNYDDKKMTVRDRDIRVPYVRKEAPKRDNIQVDFFPEGGNLISGISNRVAFKATDKEGRSIGVSGTVYDDQDNEVTRFTSLHRGMGFFDFVPQAEVKRYHVRVSFEGKEGKMNLPLVNPSGYAMQVNNLLPNNLLIQVEKTSDLLPQMLGLSISCRGKVYAIDILTIDESNKAIVQVPKMSLPTGVQQITLFTSAGEVIAERLAFINHEDPYAVISATVRQDSLSALQPIEVDLEVRDGANRPMPSTFSLAIRDKGNLLETYHTDNIRTNLLLSSELRGYIEDPAYYFEANDNKHRLALDLLMLVQGWRRYDWKQMAGIEPFEVQYGIEHSLLLEGQVLSIPWKKIQEGMDVKMWAINKNTGESINGDCVTDEEGYFNFDMGDIEGHWDLNLQTTREKKRKATKILLTRHDAPQAKHPEFQETTFPELQEGDREQKKEELVQKIRMTKDEMKYRQKKNGSEDRPVIALPDSLKSYQLNEVVVDGKKKESPLAKYARLNANLRYDVDVEMEKFINKDDEYFEHSLWYLLGAINPHFRTFKGYKDRGCKVYYDDMELSFDPGLDIEDIKSVVVVEHDAYDYSKAAVYIYTKNNGKRIRRPNGIRRSYFFGYHPPQEYYNPDYTYGTLMDISDHRRTLYWNPNIKTDNQGRVSIKFFNNSTCTQLDISAEGMNGSVPMMYLGEW